MLADTWKTYNVGYLQVSEDTVFVPGAEFVKPGLKSFALCGIASVRLTHRESNMAGMLCSLDYMVCLVFI